MSEEQLKASLDAEGLKPLEEGVEDVELTDEELAGVAGGCSAAPIVVTANQFCTTTKLNSTPG